VKRIVTSAGGCAGDGDGDGLHPPSASTISTDAPSRTSQPPIRFTNGTIRSTNACLW
jgi:hypothetical protein